MFVKGFFLIFYSALDIFSRLFFWYRTSFENDLTDLLLVITLIMMTVGIGVSISIVIFISLYNKETRSENIKRFVVKFWMSIGLEIIAIAYRIFNNSIIYAIGAPLILFELGPGISRVLLLLAAIVQIFSWSNFIKHSNEDTSPSHSRGVNWIRISLFVIIGLYLLDTFYQVIETMFLDLGFFIGNLFSVAKIMHVFGGIGFISIGYYVFQIPGHFMVAKVQDQV